MQTNRTIVNVTVLDVNDNSPNFTGTILKYNTSEGRCTFQTLLEIQIGVHVDCTMMNTCVASITAELLCRKCRENN